MKLFDETESKYYELISYLLLQKRDFTGSDVDRLYAELFQGEKDYEILEALFSEKEGKEALFSYADGKFTPILGYDFPVRCSKIEQQAFGAIANLKYADRFLSEDTLSKIRRLNKSFVADWRTGDIEIKNQHTADGVFPENTDKMPVDDLDHDTDNALRIIAEAILENRSILYDNVKDGVYEYRDETAFPVRIEYSLLNDAFRISAYNPGENRFFMMTLDTMRHIRGGKERMDDIQKEYKAFLARNRKKVILDVEPTGHVIERCFRIFSYYERKAVYNREEEKYRLEIVYNAFDEAEIVRNILSLGSSVVVLEPLILRRKIRDRILEAANAYSES